MTITKLKAAFDRALSRRKVTLRDVEAIERALRDGGGLNLREVAALRAFATRYRDRFDAAGGQQLDALLEQLPRSSPPSPPVPSSSRWDEFSVPASRDGVAGPQKQEGLSTFDELSSSVSAGELTPADQLLLASAAAKVGIMGEAQAVRAVKLLEALSSQDAAAFRGLADQARSPLERAFLFKALGAGNPLPVLTAFADAIRGWANARLLEELNLADAVIDDAQQNGLTQQLNASCVVTTAQLLRGEVDPVYALAVRTQNVDVHKVDEQNPFRLNPRLTAAQGHELDELGGSASPRDEVGYGVTFDKIDGVYNGRINQTGVLYSLMALDQRPDLNVDVLLDLLAVQLREGIPTPLLVGDALSPKRHALLALEVRGEGEVQAFLVHDPWSGDTLEISRAQFRESRLPLGAFNQLGAIHLATPVA